MGRGKNDAEVNEVVKVMRAELHLGARESDYMQADIEKVIEVYTTFIIGLLKISAYPSCKAVTSAAMKAWGLDQEASVAFANRIIRAIWYCRNKKKSVSSGTKLPLPIKMVISQLAKAGSKGDPKSPKSGKTLKRRRSDESKTSPAVKKKKATPRQAPVRASSSLATKEEIFALYRMKLELDEGVSKTPVLPCFEEEAIEVSSTQLSTDSDVAAHGKTAAENPPKMVLPKQDSIFKPWLCGKDLCMKRLATDGSVECALMSQGPNGFAYAQFGDSEKLETELPNLTLETKAVAMKRPASSRKKKQIALAQTPLCSSDDEPQAATDIEKEAPPPASGGEVQAALAETGTKPSNFTFHAQLWGSCKAEFYTSKSYIRHLHEGKWKLVVGCNKSEHHSNLLALVDHVKAGKTKADLVTERDVLEAPDAS